MKLVLIVIALSWQVVAQKGEGLIFGSRDPHTCGSTKTVGKAAPSDVVVREAVVCANEHVAARDLYLVENLKVDVAAKGRPYNPNTDTGMSAIDVDVPVYAIRGSYSSYLCSQVSDYMKNAGKNCTIFEQPTAVGRCYKTTFGDWKCSLVDLTNHKPQPGMPPPLKN